MPRTSVFRDVADAVNAKLREILTAEGRQVPMFGFGREPFKENDHDVRVVWMQPQGSFFTEPNQGATKANPTDPAPPVTPLYMRRAECAIWLSHASDEDVEHLLESVVRASKRTPYDKFFHWATAHYKYPSQTIGESVKNGVSVIRLEVLLDIQINAELDGEYVMREVLADKLKAGIVADVDDELDETDLAVNEWPG